MIPDPLQPVDEVGEIATGSCVQHLHRHELGLGSRANDSMPIDGRGNNSGDVGPMAVIIVVRLPLCDGVESPHNIRGQIRVVKINAAIQHGNRHP